MLDESQKKPDEHSKKEGLDAIDALEALNTERKKGESDEKSAGARGAFQDKKVSKKLTTEQKRFLWAIIGASMLVLLWISWRAYGVMGIFSGGKKEKGDVIKNNVSKSLGQNGIHTQEQKMLKDNENHRQILIRHNDNREVVEVEDDVLQRRLGSSLVGSENTKVPQREESSRTDGGSDNKGAVSALQKKMEPIVLKAHQAGRLKNRDMLLTQGTMLDCQLETRIVSTQPGMVSCYTTRDVYASSGRVVLVDKGSKVVGHYDGGIQQGQARIFILWDRIETPEGVVVNLESPGTGALGEAGVGGWVDNHFMERFGGAILISLIGDIGEYVANLGNKESKNRIQFTNTSDGAQQAATEVLKHSLNIGPTLYKNQGERISIFVARDLDFSNVYELKRTY